MIKGRDGNTAWVQQFCSEDSPDKQILATLAKEISTAIFVHVKNQNTDTLALAISKTDGVQCKSANQHGGMGKLIPF